MSFSTKLKTLQSVAQSLDYLQRYLSSDEIFLEDFFLVSDILNRVSDFQKELDKKKIVLEVDVIGLGDTPNTLRLAKVDESGRTIGMTVFFGDASTPQGSSAASAVSSK